MRAKEYLDKQFNALESDKQIQTELAKASALFMYRSTGESEKNFREISVDEAHVNQIGIEYIDLGCRYFEIRDYNRASACLTKGAECLETVYGVKGDKLVHKRYYGLLASMAFYAGFQYSRAFLLIGKFREETLIASFIDLFLRRKFDELTSEIENLVVKQEYDDARLSHSEDFEDAYGKVFELTFAKCLYCFVQYFYTGDESLVLSAKEKLQLLLDITQSEGFVDLWWVARLLNQISDGFRQSSLWTALGEYYDLHDKDSLARKYVLALTYKPTPITELFLSQRGALPKLLNPESKGTIVTIPTSSGKTRIAEIAVIDALAKNPDAKILYVAPFRSLAYEIERSLGDLFAVANIKVSHLYGGGLFTNLDAEELSDANVVIATPEKTKAIFRCQTDFFKNLSLIILDEGHLIGGDTRQLSNEIFYEELKRFLTDYPCKYLLLSAVLPNSSDLSSWLTGSNNNVYLSDWRPSKQICGILTWNTVSVDLEWYKGNKISVCNKNFVHRFELPRKPRQRVIHYYPSDKKEAIVETARKLESFGSTLIFVTQKRSCRKYAEAYSKSIKGGQQFIFRDKLSARIFELVCKETYREPEIYRYAQKGVFYHNADLFADVRIALEALMRREHPRVIIATSTLSQGVNLNVSTVIMSSATNGGKPLSRQDFWNLAGRAGRAYVDEEGKVLVAFEPNKKKSRQFNMFLKSKIVEYFDKTTLNTVTSGLYQIVKAIHDIAIKTNTSFEYLLDLIANNKPLPQIEEMDDLENVIVNLDDCLLSMHENYSQDKMDLSWIEDTFCKSLAYIQASNVADNEVSPDKIIAFVKSKVKGILGKLQPDTSYEHLVMSGLSLQKSIELDDSLNEICLCLFQYRISPKSIDELILLMTNIEEILAKLPSFENRYFKLERISKIREAWMKGVPVCDMNLQGKDEEDAVKKYFSYDLPWYLNGIVGMLRNKHIDIIDEESISVLSELALLVETGLPDRSAVKIYRSGVRSRSCALEISRLISSHILGDKVSSYRVRSEIVRQSAFWKQLSEKGKQWVEILKEEGALRKNTQIRSISPFSIRNWKGGLARFKAVIVNDQKYFISLDLDKIMPMKASERDFSQVGKIKGVYFEYNSHTEEYEMNVLNPYLRIQ